MSAQDLALKGASYLRNHLAGNGTINSLYDVVPGTNAILRGLSEYGGNGQLGKALSATMYKDGEFDAAGVAGAGFTAFAAGDIGIGAVHGAFTDSNGNADMPGIPFI